MKELLIPILKESLLQLVKVYFDSGTNKAVNIQIRIRR